VQERQAADVGELAGPFQRLGEGHGIDGLALGVERLDCLPEGPMGGPVEVVGDEEAGATGERVGADQHRAEYRLFRLDGDGWLALAHADLRAGSNHDATVSAHTGQ